MMIIRGVNVYPSQIEAVLVGIQDVAPHYQLVIRREGVLDTLQIDVEAEPSFDGDSKQLGAEVKHHIKSLIGVSCTVNVLPEGEIPRSQGKAVRVRDLRND